VPLNGGCFRNVEVITRPGSVVHAQFPAAVVAGNTETSQRIVDVIFGALAKVLPNRIPAASCGTMSSVALGGEDWTYYETVGGGSGASLDGDGASAVQCHMTNTLNTPAEAIEMQYPLRVRRFERATGTGGGGKHRGGDGIIREIEALEPCTGTVITDRRISRPYGLQGGAPAQAGRNAIISNREMPLAGKAKVQLLKGDVLSIITPGGGGWAASDTAVAKTAGELVPAFNIEDLEKLAIVRALEIAGSIANAAARLGVSVHTLERKMRQYGISPPSGGRGVVN
jgi:N-methylhydantoinase B